MIRITLAIAALAIVMLVPAGSSSADENEFGRCPDGYTPTPFIVGPSEDRNGNGVICVKFVGSHDNTNDDPNGKKYACNGFPTPPPECVQDPDGSYYVLDDII